MEGDLNLERLLEKLGEEPDSVEAKLKAKCQHPRCQQQSRDTHHLTYEPEVVTRLCGKHHRAITTVNSNAAFKLGRKLTNWERLKLWNDWIDGKVSPKKTPQSTAWLRGRK